MSNNNSRREFLKKASIGSLATGAAVTAPVTMAADDCVMRGTGDLGVVIERSTGSVLVVDTTAKTIIQRIENLGDLSHASAVMSRDQRYAYIFGRDGSLTKVDLLVCRIDQRTVQAGNSIGGAISQDGRFVAVSNYTPGGVRIFDAASLQLLADIPTPGSKTVGLVDTTQNRFVFALYDKGEIWLVNMDNPQKPRVEKFTGIGKLPYDALVTPDGRHYVAGLFGEDGMAMLDLWQPEKGVTRVMDGYGKGDKPLPVYKMPHLEGWAAAGDKLYVPAVGHHGVLIVDRFTWEEVGRIPVHGQPVFVMARPDGRYVWVNFAVPHNDTVQVIDTLSGKIVKTLKPGKGVLHMEFAPRGEAVWLSVRDENIIKIYDTESFELIESFAATKPSGIFFTSRAHKIGL